MIWNFPHREYKKGLCVKNINYVHKMLACNQPVKMFSGGCGIFLASMDFWRREIDDNNEYGALEKMFNGSKNGDQKSDHGDAMGWPRNTQDLSEDVDKKCKRSKPID